MSEKSTTANKDADKPPVRTFNGLRDLNEIFLKKQKYHVEIGGERIEFVLTPLSSKKLAEAERFNQGIVPPKKRVGPIPGTNGKFEEEYDENDPVYLEKKESAWRQERVFILLEGVEGLQIEGENLIQKADKLEEALPPNIINTLYSKIMELSGGTLKMVDFFSNAVSPQS